MADPNIISVVPTKGVDTICMVMIENTGPTGMVRGEISNYTGVCQAPAGTQIGCVPTTTNPYISQLYWYMPIQAFSVFDNICLKLYNCAAGDDCINSVCSAWNSSPYTSRSNIAVGYALGVTPGPISALSATPGPSSITVSWNPPDNAPIFGYPITLKETNTGKLLVNGIVNRTSLMISNLTNGVSYTISVSSRSDDGYGGPASSISATPIAPCPTPLCNMILT